MRLSRYNSRLESAKRQLQGFDMLKCSGRKKKIKFWSSTSKPTKCTVGGHLKHKIWGGASNNNARAITQYWSIHIDAKSNPLQVKRKAISLFFEQCFTFFISVKFIYVYFFVECILSSSFKFIFFCYTLCVFTLYRRVREKIVLFQQKSSR